MAETNREGSNDGIGETNDPQPQSKRKLRYSVAQSLDGYIATKTGQYDWIPNDTDIQFTQWISKIDTLIMGRTTYETTTSTEEGRAIFEGMDVYVVSDTMGDDNVESILHEGVKRIISGKELEEFVRGLKKDDGDGRKKDIWLFGGGVLFRSLVSLGLVDRVEVAVVPVLLGDGIPLLPPPSSPRVAAAAGGGESSDNMIVKMKLHSTETFEKSGMVLLKYDVVCG